MCPGNEYGGVIGPPTCPVGVTAVPELSDMAIREAEGSRLACSSNYYSLVLFYPFTATCPEEEFDAVTDPPLCPVGDIAIPKLLDTAMREVGGSFLA